MKKLFIFQLNFFFFSHKNGEGEKDIRGIAFSLITDSIDSKVHSAEDN